MNLLDRFRIDRDTIRARQDASARIAPTLLERPTPGGLSIRDIVRAEEKDVSRSFYTGTITCPAIIDTDPADEQPVTVREHLEANRPMVIDFAAARANRPDYGPSVAETLEMIETVAIHVYQGTTGKSWTDQKATTFPMRKKVREGVRAGLVAAGLVRA